MPWRPLDKRGQPDPRLDEPVEGLPPHLRGPVLDWTRQAFHPGYEVQKLPLERFQLQYRLDPPLNLSAPDVALRQLLARMDGDEEFALVVVDFALYYLTVMIGSDVHLHAQALDRLLSAGGSVWEVAPVVEDDQPRFQLARRAVGPIRDAIMELPPSSRAHQHLVTAWNRLSGRDPDPSSAYREAVRAIEAAAKPIILPKNDRATLGTMIVAMRDAPQKWTVTLGEVEDVQRMMAHIWTNQLDRHGTDDESVPLAVSQGEADAAVHLALALVRLFVGGHVRPQVPQLPR